MLVANERDLLVVAVRNILRAPDRIPAGRQPEMADQKILERLRNITEHYDEVGGKSIELLTGEHPTVEPSAVAYSSIETWIGGVDGIPLTRIQAWLERVRQALVGSLTEAGHEVPSDLMTSIVPGDDDLPWPPERLSYH